MSLPYELIIQILENLDYRNLLTCMQVTTRFRAMINRTASLQYIIELAVSGQKDGHDSMISSGDKLDLLRKHQSAWKNMTWSRELAIPMGNGGLWEIFGGILAQNNESGQLIFHQLPSDLRGIEEKSWTLGPNLGCTVGDFAMDPYQDLLVITEGPNANAVGDSDAAYRIHLRSLTTGNSHPLATNPKLNLLQHGEDVDAEISYTIQIFGDFVGVLFTPRTIYHNQVVIWEWKTGRMLVNIFSEDLESFSLLSYLYLVLALCDDYGQPELFVVYLAEESSDCKELHEVEHGEYLSYPKLDNDSFIHSLQLRADPGPLHGENTNVPFYQDSTNFILVLNMWISEDDIEKHLMHFIPSQYLMSVMKSGAPHPTPHSWISQNTRMYVAPDREASDVWVCYVYGTRFITSAHPLVCSRVKGELPIKLYDFNRLALRRGAQTSALSDMPGSVNSSPNHIHSGQPFNEDAETSLPYWTNVAHLDVGKAYDQHFKVMCCEDNIVIVDLESRIYRVLVF